MPPRKSSLGLIISTTNAAAANKFAASRSFGPAKRQCGERQAITRIVARMTGGRAPTTTA